MTRATKRDIETAESVIAGFDWMERTGITWDGYDPGKLARPSIPTGGTMKCITVCEPYATLICLPKTDERRKRIENRRWKTRYTGPLLIHAGKSRDYVDPDELSEPWPYGYGMKESDLTFGAILGVCRMVGCLAIEDIQAGRAPKSLEWTKDHHHAEGPFCFVLGDVRRFPSPVPYIGAQGFFDVTGDVVASQLDAVGWR